MHSALKESQVVQDDCEGVAKDTSRRKGKTLIMNSLYSKTDGFLSHRQCGNIE